MPPPPSNEAAFKVARDLLFMCRGAAPLACEHGHFLIYRDPNGDFNQERFDDYTDDTEAMWRLVEAAVLAHCGGDRVCVALMSREDADTDDDYRAIAFALVDDVYAMETFDRDGLDRRTLTIEAKSLLPLIAGIIIRANIAHVDAMLDHIFPDIML